METVNGYQAPNPFVPLHGTALSTQCLPGIDQCAALHRRRAQILAATRRLLAVDGHDRFTLRSVSDASGVSPQTIYNSFGCKDQLIQAALNQHTVSIDSLSLSKSKDPIVFLILALGYCQTAIDYPDFLRQFMLAVADPQGGVRQKLLKFGANLKAEMLRDLSKRGLLRNCIDPKIAADQIAYVNSFSVQEWAENDDFNQLYNRIVFGNGSIMLGILVPEEGKKIEDWLSSQSAR